MTIKDLSVTDLQALISAELCHIEARSTLQHDNPHLVNIREAVAELTRKALLGKFTTLAHGNYREFVENGGLRKERL